MHKNQPIFSSDELRCFNTHQLVACENLSSSWPLVLAKFSLAWPKLALSVPKPKNSLFWKDPAYLRKCIKIRKNRSEEVTKIPIQIPVDQWWKHVAPTICGAAKLKRNCVACVTFWYDPSVRQQIFYSPASSALSTVTFQYPASCLLANDHTFDHIRSIQL